MVVLNIWSVDLKKRLMVLTDDPDNKEFHRIVIRANTHKRDRLDNSRFSSALTVDLPFRKMTDIIHDAEKEHYCGNWLGETWYYKYNNKMYPSINQIEAGLIKEALVQLRLSMVNLKDSKARVIAENNIIKTWKILMSKAEIPDRNQPLA